MRDQEIIGLWEAYLQVHSQPQEEIIDEESVEAGQDPHKINTAKAKQVTAPKGVGVPSKEKGYVPLKDSTDLFDIIKGYLLDEGYADTEQAAEAIMVNMSEDWRESVVEEVLNESDNYDKNRRRAAQRAAARNAARSAGKTGAVPGVGYVTPRKERETYTDSTGVERHTSGARMPKKQDQKESFDLFDTILEYLVSEGYADTNENALVIMANMSEEWRQDIVEAEVLAMKGGVPGSVKVKPTLSIPGTSIGVGPNKPVSGTFTTTTPGQREKIASGSPTIDRGIYQQSRVGAGPTSAERQRYNVELTRQGKYSASRMSQ